MTNAQDKEAILKKIKKLMALAGSCNENEAKAAAEKAQELMVRHQLTVQCIQNVDFEYEDVNIGQAKKIMKEHSLILHILSQHFFVKTYLHPRFTGYSRTGKRQYNNDIQIVGTPVNVAVAKYVFDYLLHTYKRLWKDYKGASGCDESAKGAYFYGLTEGIKSRLKEVKIKVETETGLVVIDDQGLVAKMKEMSLKKRQGPSYSRDADAEADGFDHGKKVQIARGLDNNSENKGFAIGYNK